MYNRSPALKDCIQAFVDYGLNFDDNLLLQLFLENKREIQELLDKNPKLLHKKYTLNSTFTPLYEVSLLHICAEYNFIESAGVLLKYDININLRAGKDENGFGGQSAIFHTVNQHQPKSIEMMKFLILNGAKTDITLKGLIWGKGYEWETYIPETSLISYAMMGFLPQFQRKENAIYEVVNILMKKNHAIEYRPANVPNKYLNN